MSVSSYIRATLPYISVSLQYLTTLFVSLSLSLTLLCSRPRIRGLVEIEPIFHTVFASVYQYAISELCQGLYHRNGV